MNDHAMKKMHLLIQLEGIDFYKYSPTLFQPYYMDYPKKEHPPYANRMIHKVRMMLEYLRGGYQVIYMVRNHKILGHIVVARGGRRLKVSTSDDIVLGPIFVTPDCRGEGIGSFGIRVVLKEIGLQYRYAFEFIKYDNIASIRTVEKNGYIPLGRVKEVGLLKNLVPASDGDFVVYRFEA